MTKKKIQQTLILIKPDALVKSLTGNIISKISHPSRRIMGAKIVQVTKELAEEHYQHLKDADFFDELIQYIMGEYHTKRVLALVYEGEDVIEQTREVVGKTNPEEAHPETLRGKYGRIHSKTNVFENVIHASENEEEAEREIKLWFRPDEIIHTIYPVKKEKIAKTELIWK